MSPARVPKPDALRRLVANPWVAAGSIAAGMALGKLAPGVAVNLGLIGDIYIDLLKMVILPFLVAAVIFSLRKLLADPRNASILPRILLTFGAVFGLAALAGLLAGLLLAPGRNLAPETLLALGKLAGNVASGQGHDTVALFGLETASKAQGLGDLLLTLIPSNVFSALTEGEILKVLAFSLLFGLAAGKGSGEATRSLTDALETVYHACLKLTQWFNLLLPLVLFVIVASQTAKTGLEPLRAMFKFLLALGLAALLVVSLSLGLLVRASGRPWSEVLRSQRDPLLMAVATRSSNACMPTMIASLVEGLGFERDRIELLVPLGVTLLRVGPAFYYAAATAFIAQLYDMPLGLTQVGVVLGGSLLAGLSSAGMSGLLVISLIGMVCHYLRLPFEAAVALFLAVDPVCDVLRAMVGVAGNNAFAAVAAGVPEPRSEGEDEAMP